MRFSILNRLMDPADAQANDIEYSYDHVAKLKDFIQRDLNALLNTRRATQDFDPAYEQATNSVLSFGIVDFTSYNLTSVIDQERVRTSIERAIRQFEPRLSQVQVLLEPADEKTPVLRFHIEALLRLGEATEDVTFHGRLLRDFRRVAISGADR